MEVEQGKVEVVQAEVAESTVVEVEVPAGVLAGTRRDLVWSEAEGSDNTFRGGNSNRGVKN